MGKKLAVMFPGIGYSVDRPLLYYTKRILETNGYEVVNVNYMGLELETLSESQLLSFLAKAKEVARGQLEKIDFAQYEKLIFVSKSIGAVVGSICAKQMGIKPYHIMITPFNQAFQFVEDANGSVFGGTDDSMVDYDGLQEMCKECAWDFHSFKACNHSLETENVEADVEHLKRFVSVIKDIVANMDESIYDFEVLGRNQQCVSMSQYKEKVLLIVNTATGCGFTPQYQVLEQIYKKYKEQGFEILDFPCNQFNNQAPGTEMEIHSFCTSRYDITFEQFAKVCVNGEHQSELFRFLKSRKGFKGFDMSIPESKYLVHKLEKEEPGYESSSDIKWNFTKFLVNRQGQVIERFEPTTDLAQVEEAILQLL